MMTRRCHPLSRRDFLAAAAAGVSLGPWLSAVRGEERKRPEEENKALVAITLDLEMSRNFPTWETTHWDYEKGNLNDETKKYAVEACKRVKARGGVLHCFLVGRVLEQESVAWLRDILDAGHPVGNHTYDHVNVKATRAEDVQFRFRRAPWLIAGKQPLEAITENIRITEAAFQSRLDRKLTGFRTPGGFGNGLADRPDVQQILLDLGYIWVSSKYPAHPMNEAGKEPTQAVFDGIVKAQAEAQPFVYPKGLIEVPMSPISDISAFRGGRWKLEWFLKAVRLGVEWAIEHRAGFDFLGHPSCLYVTDPELRAIDLICELVGKAGDRAALVGLDTIARRAGLRGK
jgi:hypothetical protein